MAVEPMEFAKGKSEIGLLPGMANRHGLIAGATGTGKTITLQVLAEHFSDRGVPVFLADVKGDLAGISQAGGQNPKVQERIQKLGVSDWKASAYPVVFWDVMGEQGHPVRATISEMGPVLLSRILNLNDTQEGVLNIVFKAADDNGLLLLDLKDLRAMLEFVSEHADEVKSHYGNVSAASVGAIQRGLLTLEQQCAEKFFGEPTLDLGDLMQAEEYRGPQRIEDELQLLESQRAELQAEELCQRELAKQEQAIGDSIYWPIYNLDSKNPNSQQDFEHQPPEQLVADILTKEQRIIELVTEIKGILAEGVRDEEKREEKYAGQA